MTIEKKSLSFETRLGDFILNVDLTQHLGLKQQPLNLGWEIDFLSVQEIESTRNWKDPCTARRQWRQDGWRWRMARVRARDTLPHSSAVSEEALNTTSLQMPILSVRRTAKCKKTCKEKSPDLVLFMHDTCISAPSRNHKNILGHRFASYWSSRFHDPYFLINHVLSRHVCLDLKKPLFVWCKWLWLLL